MHTFTHSHMHTFTSFTHSHIFHTCKHSHMHTFTHSHHSHMHTCTHSHIHTFTHSHIHTFTSSHHHTHSSALAAHMGGVGFHAWALYKEMELLGGVRCLLPCAPMNDMSFASFFGSVNRWICSGIKAKRVFRKVTIFSIFIFLGSVNQWICSGSKAKRVFRKVTIYTKCAHFLAQGIDGFVLVLRPKRVFRKVTIFSISIFLGSVNRWICSGIKAKIVCRKVFSYNFIHFHTFS
jgi:hypothetical protein